MIPGEFLRRLFDAAVGAADPALCLPSHLPALPTGRTVVVAAGKAAASMARAVEDHWTAPMSGLAITRYGHGVPCKRIEIVEAGHPLPDDAGLDAAQRALDAVMPLGADDLVLCLISGGGSALLTRPAAGIALDDKRRVTEDLLSCGATIAEINCVRKHLSAIKGGRLAQAAAPARVVTLIISDVPGDDPATVASGPTVADPTTLKDARAVLGKYGVAPPPSVTVHLGNAANETPKTVAGGDVTVIACARDALAAAAVAARRHGVEPVILGDLEGDSGALARAHAMLAAAAATAPSILLSGGEATVSVGSGGGRGGPNTEFLLALAIALDSQPRVHALACDTDGIDGTGDNAGALVSPDTLSRAAAQGLDAGAALASHDSYGFFSALGDLVMTGPTRTNVNDFRAVLITAGASEDIDL